MNIKSAQLLCSEHIILIILIIHTYFILFCQTSLIQHLTHWPCLQQNIGCLFKYANKQLNTYLFVFFLLMHFLPANITFAAATSVFSPFFGMESTTGLEKTLCECQNKVRTISSREMLHFTGSSWLQQTSCQSAHVTPPLFHDNTTYDTG